MLRRFLSTARVSNTPWIRHCGTLSYDFLHSNFCSEIEALWEVRQSLSSSDFRQTVTEFFQEDFHLLATQQSTLYDSLLASGLSDEQIYFNLSKQRHTCFSDTSDSGSSGDGSSTTTGSDVTPPTETSGSDEGGLQEETPTETIDEEFDYYSMTPRQMVKELDRFVIGQAGAKKAVAIAWRSRWRRRSLPEDFKIEVVPKNILMVGPTGCGKTEIARRLARLSNSPMVKVEATKFTEVGYVGKDVNTIIEDLVHNAATLIKQRRKKEMRAKLEKTVEDQILQLLMGNTPQREIETFRKQLQAGKLEEFKIDVEVKKELEMPSGFPMSKTLMILPQVPDQSTEKRNMPIKKAREVLMEQELKKVLSEKNINEEAVALAENDGIVFLDEVDKICGNRDFYRGDNKVSQEGVQRDLLPLIEGSVVQVQNFGNVKTDHILFICAGAFHNSKPSDLMPEFQGRLPVRVELQPLTENDLYRIMTETEKNLILQQIEMLKTENYELMWDDAAIKRIAKLAVECNQQVENIGARRLVTIIEKILEEVNMDAPDSETRSTHITEEFVERHLGDLMKKHDLHKFIL